MKLRSRILFFIVLTMVGLIGGVYSFASHLLMQSYNQLEHQDTLQDIDRASRAFSNADDSLHDKSIDWASWDDTYQFMADSNKAYIKSNLVADSVVSMKLDIILYVDATGKILHQFTLKRLPDLPPPNAVQLWHELHLDCPISDADRARNTYSGLILHPHCPLLVSVRPILTSKGKGPQRGWLVFGRYFDKGQLHHLAEQTRLDVQLYRVDSPAISEEDRQILAGLSPDTPVQIRPKNSQTILGYTRLSDVKNRTALLLKVTLPRHIHKQGLDSVGYLVRLIFLASLIFGGVILLLVELCVLSRLTNLTRQVEQIGDAGTTDKHVVLSGRDELASLAGQINGMLLKLERIAANLRQSQEEMRCQNENLEVIVTERTQELLHQAFHDALTGLPNRAQVLYHLKQMADRKQEGGKAVCFLDLDNFKFINDSLGHGAGDELLIAVAARLQTCVRPEDVVARLGGDEFLIVLENVESVEIVIQVAERILDVMNSGFSLSAGEGFTSVSIGISYTQSGAVEPDILIKNADTAMYHSKSGGKAAYALFEADMNDRLTERVDIEVGLRLALEQQEFCVHYQPLIDLRTGQMSGAEALVRWQHPAKGLIAPGKFIPVAEDTGLIIPLGYWVLEEACRQTVTWKRAHPDSPPFTINVNLSGKQLQKYDVVERVQEILEKTGLPAKHLKLEITESVMMTDAQGTIAKLTELRLLGVKLAMDDFGTGYSSMATLSSFPLDTVKIDRAFITRLATCPEADAVVAAIIMLAKSLNMDVTGEGVETSEQVTSLQGLGCDIGQGYLFSRPLDARTLNEKMRGEGNCFIQNVIQTDKAQVEYLLAQLDRTFLENLPQAA